MATITHACVRCPRARHALCHVSTRSSRAAVTHPPIQCEPWHGGAWLALVASGTTPALDVQGTNGSPRGHQHTPRPPRAVCWWPLFLCPAQRAASVWRPHERGMSGHAEPCTPTTHHDKSRAARRPPLGQDCRRVYREMGDRTRARTAGTSSARAGGHQRGQQRTHSAAT